MGFVATSNGGWECLDCGRCFSDQVPPDHHACIPEPADPPTRKGLVHRISTLTAEVARLEGELKDARQANGEFVRRAVRVEREILERAEKAEAERDAAIWEVQEAVSWAEDETLKREGWEAQLEVFMRKRSEEKEEIRNIALERDAARAEVERKDKAIQEALRILASEVFDGDPGCSVDSIEVILLDAIAPAESKPQANPHCRPGHDALWGWFGLSYSQFVVLARVLMHDMPDSWQGKLAALLHEFDEAFPNKPLYGCTVRATDDSGKLSHMPKWLLNYRHPDKEEIAKCRGEQPQAGGGEEA